nr:MAG TPA: hypothetical protein [Caudoviricetes sp.]
MCRNLSRDKKICIFFPYVLLCKVVEVKNGNQYTNIK